MRNLWSLRVPTWRCKLRWTRSKIRKMPMPSKCLPMRETMMSTLNSWVSRVNSRKSVSKKRESNSISRQRTSLRIWRGTRFHRFVRTWLQPILRSWTTQRRITWSTPSSMQRSRLSSSWPIGRIHSRRSNWRLLNTLVYQKIKSFCVTHKTYSCLIRIL